ncbi:hypothetical protein EDC96DRAFT_513535 [Choanephora cucurbitarum]|nr:hypothetical protein EDC96DRAFT_513535 [Choanephora cucurbitarum]
MSENALEHLPFELLSEVSNYLLFSDIWCLGTCSRKSRALAFRLLKSKYQIDFHHAHNPFSYIMYGAIAYMDRYGHENGKVRLYVLQSVANHLAMVIYDRLPEAASSRPFSYHFLLNETIRILIHNALYDPTLHSLENPKDRGIKDPKNYSHQIYQLSAELQQKLRQNSQDPYEAQSTGVLSIDFLNILYITLVNLFDERTPELFHQFLMLHLRRLFHTSKQKYQQYHSTLPQPICMDTATKDFQLFFRFLCVLIQTDLCTAEDIDDFTFTHLGPFFVTKPSDVSFSATQGLKIVLPDSTEKRMFSADSLACQYQWQLWMKETQLRMTLLLTILQSLIQKCYGGHESIQFRHITSMLQDTVSVLSWTEKEPPENVLSYLE